MNRATGMLLLAVASLAPACAVSRVSGPLPSDPIVDWSATPLSTPLPARGAATDEQVVGAVYLLLEGRLADLSGDCERGEELIEEAARLAPAHPMEEARREHDGRCGDGRPASSPDGAALARR